MKVTVSQDALDYIQNEKRISRPNLVIYRDIEKIGCCRSSAFYFMPKVKVMSKEPDSAYFTAISNNNNNNAVRIPIWVEKALLSAIIESRSVNITLKKGLLLKSLKLEIETGENERSSLSSCDIGSSTHTTTEN